MFCFVSLTGCSPFYGKSYNEILLKNKTCKISFDFSQLGVRVSQEGNNLHNKLWIIIFITFEDIDLFIYILIFFLNSATDLL